MRAKRAKFFGGILAVLQGKTLKNDPKRGPKGTQNGPIFNLVKKNGEKIRFWATMGGGTADHDFFYVRPYHRSSRNPRTTFVMLFQEF